MNNIAFGKYIHGDSLIHRMDPRIKLAMNVIFVVLVFLANNLILLLSLMSFPLLLYLFSPLSKRYLIRIAFTSVFIGFFLFLVTLFVIKAVDSTSNWFTPLVWWKITITEIGIIRTIYLILRVYTMILVTTILMSTTKHVALTRAIEDLLLPLKLLRIPVHIIAMIISIALRFIPTLLEEAQRIMKAQASRGVDFENGNFKAKSKSLVTLIIPLFVSSFAKAEDLGNAMEVRGYDPYEKRVRYRSYRLHWYDYVVALILVGLIVIVALQLQNVLVFPMIW